MDKEKQINSIEKESEEYANRVKLGLDYYGQEQSKRDFKAGAYYVLEQLENMQTATQELYDSMQVLKMKSKWKTS